MISPKYTPKLSRQAVLKILEEQGLHLKNEPLILLGIRGYYLNDMGEKGKNDRAIYDDAFFWITETDFISYNGNTDPSKYRIGYGFGRKKGMACLKTGIWRYKLGIHNISKPPSKQYPAFVQAQEVAVLRDGVPNYDDIGYFGINIHRGATLHTSSAGCHTVPNEQWASFRSFGCAKFKQYGLQPFPYCLVEKIGDKFGIFDSN
jgi:hypothetical protein